MEHPPQKESKMRGLNRTATGVCALAVAACFAPAARGQIPVFTINNGGYHSQVTDYFCAAASMEMELDVPAVRNANPVVVGLLNAPDGATVPDGAAPPPVVGVVQNGVGSVTAGAQSFIYGLVHGQNTVNGQTYLNPFVPPGVGTDSPGVAIGLNLLDNPNVNGTTGPAFGSHAYASYNLAPTITGGVLASRTIANALADTQVPAQITVGHGAHAIVTYGVSTSAAPGAGHAYNINGFFIHDPWTGYAVSQFLGGNAAPALAGGFGLGFNTYLRYGYDVIPGYAATQLPDGSVVPARLGAWFNNFNPAGGQPGTPPLFQVPGYKFEVEPIGPELPDDGSNGFGLPTPPPLISTISGQIADTDAMQDIANDPDLSTEPGLTGGSFDSAHEMFMPMPGDLAGEGDWLVPYDGAGGINDITGAALIDADTGVIDMATWLNPDDPANHLTLDQLDMMFTDISNNLTPQDNPVPEPTTLALGMPVIAYLATRRNRRRN
jgi:hypothetical protein